MRHCRVYVNNIEAGLLTENDNPREYTFKYNRKYVKENRPAVSLSLPVSEKEYKSQTLFPYFFNLLSEGENRAIQSSLLHIDKDDDFGILLATAQYDTIGAVTVRPIND